MKARAACFGAVLVLGLSFLIGACSMIEPPPPSLPKATIIPPTIPHSLEGYADCRDCHEAGLGGAPQLPTNHDLRPNDVCIACHDPALVETTLDEALPVVKSAEEVYTQKCAVCHGADRQGVSGLAPPLTPESLAHLADPEMRDVVSDGTAGTMMPGFKDDTSLEEISALIEFIKSPLP